MGDFLGSFLGGLFGGGNDQSDAIASSAATSAKATTDAAKIMADSQKYAIDTIKAYQDKALNVSIDNWMNQLTLGKSDYVRTSKAKASLEALTYGKPAKYTSDIKLKMAQAAGTSPEKQSAAQAAGIDTTFSKAPQKGPQKSPQNLITTTTADWYRQQLDNLPKTQKNGNQISPYTVTVAPNASGDFDVVGPNNKKLFTVPKIQAEKMNLSQTQTWIPDQLSQRFGESVDNGTIAGPVVNDNGTITQTTGTSTGVNTNDNTNLVENHPGSTALDGESTTTGPVTGTTLADNGSLSGIMPMVETVDAEITPEELTSQLGTSDAFKRALTKGTEAITGLASAGGLRSGRAIAASGDMAKDLMAQEEQKLWGRLSQLAGYGSDLTASSNAAGNSATNLISGAGSNIASTINSTGSGIANITAQGGQNTANIQAQAANIQPNSFWGDLATIGVSNWLGNSGSNGSSGQAEYNWNTNPDY